MAFNWNFRPARIPGMLQGPDVNEELARQATIQQAAENMQGYRPSVNLNSQFAMQGYTPADNSFKGGFAQPDLNGYGESLQAASDAAAQAQAKEEKIADIQNQIATLEKRIAENTAKLQNFTGNVDQIAAIEARKINTADPTSIWRWKVDRDEARRIAKEEKNKTKQLTAANALIEATNTIENMVVNPLMDTSTKNTMLSKLADIKSNLQKNGLPTKMADDKIKEIKGESVQTTATTPAAGLPFRGTAKEIGTAQADNIIQKGIEKVTQKEINELKRQVESGEIIVDNEKMNEIDDLYNKVVERDKQRTLSRRYEEARKKFNIPKARWDLMSKAKKKEYLEKSGV
jgi:hypothetical protein